MKIKKKYIVAVDVGGTKTNIGYFINGKLIKIINFPTKKFGPQNINKISRNNLGWGKSPKKGERKILNLLNQRERDKINTLDLTGRPVNSSINVLIHNINKLNI